MVIVMMTSNIVSVFTECDEASDVRMMVLPMMKTMLAMAMVLLLLETDVVVEGY